MDDEARALLATFIEKITDTVKNLHDAVAAQENRLDRLEQKFIESLDVQLNICNILKEMNR